MVAKFPPTISSQPDTEDIPPIRALGFRAPLRDPIRAYGFWAPYLRAPLQEAAKAS